VEGAGAPAFTQDNDRRAGPFLNLRPFSQATMATEPLPSDAEFCPAAAFGIPATATRTGYPAHFR